MQQKQCAHCKEFKDADSKEFSPDKGNKDGFYSWCRECQRAKHRAWWAARVPPKFDPETLKICRDCKVEKKITDFVPSKDYPDGFTSICRECRNAQAREYCARPEIKEHMKPIKRLKGIKLRHGLSYDEYKKMCAESLFCPICLRPFDEKLQQVVDHNHSTGVIRELLCGNCNVLLGHVKEDCEILSNMAEYLIKHKESCGGLICPDVE